jgi:hypothetical protein
VTTFDTFGHAAGMLAQMCIWDDTGDIEFDIGGESDAADQEV